MELVSPKSSVTFYGQIHDTFSAFMLLDLSLQHLTLLTLPCLPGQYTLLISSYLLSLHCRLFLLLPAPNANGSAHYLFSHYILSLNNVFSSLDLHNTNMQKIQTHVSNPAFSKFYRPGFLNVSQALKTMSKTEVINFPLNTQGILVSSKYLSKTEIRGSGSSL